ncbi:MAG: PEP-utilizing enzyme [SAR202 cluster bacterium]|jgi:pyruvate,water dikinase|nr:PEP-utilizing enzyme [SAR202 cluster bacterium]
MPDKADGFPVHWDNPKDANLHWGFDPMHTPDVMSPLGFDLYYEPFVRGFSDPLMARLVNHYAYFASDASNNSPRRPQTFTDAVESLFDGWRKWHDSILPEVLGEIEYYRGAEFDSFDNQRLIDEIDRLIKVRLRSGQLHEQAIVAYFRAMNLLLDTYTKYTGRDDVAGIRLVQGYGSKSVEAGQALWNLSRIAKSIPTVEQALLALNSKSAISGLDKLREEIEAQPFLDALETYLDEFGWRSDLYELATPTWAENPTIPLGQIRAYLEMEDYDPNREIERAQRVRDQTIRHTLNSLKPRERQKLEAALDVATKLAPIQEDHNFYIDQRLAFLPRRLALAIGRRLVSAEALRQEADVFYLHADEVRSALRGEIAECAQLVGERKQEMEYWSAVTPPSFIGAPKQSSDSIDRFSGTSWLESEHPNGLQGNGCSAGVARGPARVLRNLDEVDRLQPGDILIARTTMPAWTPLFGVTRAIITETGGILSHAAVTAREYGIPAVMGVSNATRIIRDGQMLEVDGSEGTVRIVS